MIHGGNLTRRSPTRAMGWLGPLLRGMPLVTDDNGPPLIPVRMLNEFTYCPRLFYIEFVDGLYEDSVDTVAGTIEHASVDRSQKRRRRPPADADASAQASPAAQSTRVALADSTIGLTGRLDVVEAADGVYYPVEYKHGAPPAEGRAYPDRIGSSGTWINDEVQVCAQGMLLEANGMPSPRGLLFYRQTQEQVVVDFTDALRERVHHVIAQARSLTAASATTPPPLVDDPRCVRCSLAPVCLPDETHRLALAGGEAEQPLRRIVPAADDLGVLYVNTQGATVRRDGEVLVVRSRDASLGQVPLGQVRQLSVFGNVQITTQTLQTLLREGVPVAFFSLGGAFYGLAQGLPTKNVEWRRQQYLRFHHPETVLQLARVIVSAKIRNQRTVLKRNHPGLRTEVTDRMADVAKSALSADSLQSLLGLEGTAARLYYGHWDGMLKPKDGKGTFVFNERNRRPPLDPVNAMLSLAYSVLAKDLTVAVSMTGLDPMFGFYHQPRFGRPALALDLMEEFRPLIADSVVLGLVNNQMLAGSDFVTSSLGCNLTDHGRGVFFQVYEKRKQQLITHPLFGYRMSYGRMLELQARLLGRFLLGEVRMYEPIVTR